MHKIIDNFLTDDEFNHLEHIIMKSVDFPWYYVPQVLTPQTGLICEEQFNYQMGHMFFNNSQFTTNHAEIIFPLLDTLKANFIFKIKANLNPATNKIVKHGYHNDVRHICTTGVFYVNTNNGFTEFESGEKVNSVANRMLLFPSNVKHTGTTCTDKKIRVVINFNFN
jgi:hypothetical protein